MWIALVAAVAAGWLVLAVAGALLIGRAVSVADRRRPRAARLRRSALDRIVSAATGAVPVIRPQLRAITGALPIVRPRLD